MMGEFLWIKEILLQESAPCLSEIWFNRMQEGLATATYASQVWRWLYPFYHSIESWLEILNCNQQQNIISWDCLSQKRFPHINIFYRQRRLGRVPSLKLRISHCNSISLIMIPCQTIQWTCPAMAAIASPFCFKQLANQLFCSTVSSTYAYLSSQIVTTLQYEIIKAILLDK